MKANESRSSGVVPVRCHCGQQLNVKTHLIGKTITCLVCRQPLLVGEPQSADVVSKRSHRTAATRRNGSGKRNGQPGHPWDLDKTVFQIGPNRFTWRLLATNVLGIGSTGSGKTSGLRDNLLDRAFQLGAGALITTIKSSDADEIEEIARRRGRLEDIVRINVDSPWRFDFIQWARQRQMGRSGLTTNIAEMTTALAYHKQRGEESGDSIWRELLFELVVSMGDGIVIGDGDITLDKLKEFFRTMPRSEDEVRDVAWEDGYCHQVLQRGLEREKDEVESADHDDVCHYVLQQFARLNDRTRTSVEAHWSKLMSSFRGQIRRLFCGGEVNIRPEEIWRQGKIWILDLPIDTYGEVGRIAQRLAKRCFQIAVQARTIRPIMRPALLICDECQFTTDWVDDFDILHLSICRAKMSPAVYLTQSYDAMLTSAGGGPRAQHLVGALAANLNNKFLFHCSGSTAEWASELVGRDFRFLGHASSATGGLTPGQTQGGGSESLQPILLPSDLHTLKTGGAPAGNAVEAFVFQGGKPFQNGQPVIKTAFRQRRRTND